MDVEGYRLLSLSACLGKMLSVDPFPVQRFQGLGIEGLGFSALEFKDSGVHERLGIFALPRDLRSTLHQVAFQYPEGPSPSTQ